MCLALLGAGYMCLDESELSSHVTAPPLSSPSPATHGLCSELVSLPHQHHNHPALYPAATLVFLVTLSLLIYLLCICGQRIQTM